MSISVNILISREHLYLNSVGSVLAIFDFANEIARFLVLGSSAMHHKMRSTRLEFVPIGIFCDDPNQKGVS